MTDTQWAVIDPLLPDPAWLGVQDARVAAEMVSVLPESHIADPVHAVSYRCQPSKPNQGELIRRFGCKVQEDVTRIERPSCYVHKSCYVLPSGDYLRMGILALGRLEVQPVVSPSSTAGPIVTAAAGQLPFGPRR
jgi:hypothetical protein